MEHIAGAGPFIARPQCRRRAEPLEIAAELREVVRQCVHMGRDRRIAGKDFDGDGLLVHIEDELSYDLKQLRRYLERLGPAATLRACYERSGAGYVLQRELAT